MSETKNLFERIGELVKPQKTDSGYTQLGGLLEVREPKLLSEVGVNPELSQHNLPPDRVEYIKGKAANQIQYLFAAFTNGISPEFQLKSFPGYKSGKPSSIATFDFGDSRWRQVFEDIGTGEIFEKRGYGFNRQINEQGRRVSRKTGLNRFCNHQGFFDSMNSNILLAQNQNSLFVGNYKPLMLVCMGQNQNEPLPEDHDHELLMGSDGYYTTLEDMAGSGYLVILNGLGAGSILDLHAQILPPELIEEQQLEIRKYEKSDVVTREEALKYMNWCWSNGVYATARILGNDQWVVTALAIDNQPLSIYTDSSVRSNNLSYLDKLSEDELIKVILTFIYNPGGFETNCNNLFSRQNAVEMYKELINNSNWSDDMKSSLVDELNNLDSYQRALTPMSRESVQATLNLQNEKKATWANSMVKFVKRIRRDVKENLVS